MEQLLPAQSSNHLPTLYLAQRRLGEAQGELLQFRQGRVQLHTFHGREAQVQASDGDSVHGWNFASCSLNWGNKVGCVSVDPGLIERVPTE